MNKVSIVNADDYAHETILNAIKKAINDISFKIPKKKTVLIKPNILAQNKPEQHSITHSSLIDALCQILHENKCKITIGESIAFYQKGLTKKAFIKAGIKQIADKYCAELIPFEETVLTKVTKKLTLLKELYLPKILFDADLIINVCKLKTHGGLRLSGAVKNLFGCIPGGFKQLCHIKTKNDFEMSDIFLDIYNTVKPALNIMDAVIGLDGGPSAAGKPKFVGRILASNNPVALDIVASQIIGYEPEDISTLIRAREKKIIKNFNDIKIIGEIPFVKFNKIIKGQFTDKIKNDMFVTDTFVFPVIKKSKCILCRKCLDFCPIKAISLSYKNKFYSIDYDKCIYCYYCLSGCPVKAIAVKSTFKNKFINLMRFILKI